MENRNLFYAIMFGTILAFSLGLFLRGFTEVKIADDYELIIEEKNWQLDNAIEYIKDLEQQIDTLETMIEVAYNSAITFERLVGVKEPDGIVTYKEKLLITAKQMNRIKNYKK